MRLLRPAWFEIGLDAAAENLGAVRRLVVPVYLSRGEVVTVAPQAA